MPPSPAPGAVIPGVNTIQLKVTDSAGKTSITVRPPSTLITTLTWDANGTGAGQTNGAGAWLGNNLWWDGTSNLNWVSGSNAVFGGPNTAGGAVTLASPTTVNSPHPQHLHRHLHARHRRAARSPSTAASPRTPDPAPSPSSAPSLSARHQTWTNNSAGSLTTGNGTNLIDNAGYQLTVDGTGTTTFGVINNVAAALTGSGALVKNGSGTALHRRCQLRLHRQRHHQRWSVCSANDAGALGNGNLTLNGGVYDILLG